MDLITGLLFEPPPTDMFNMIHAACPSPPDSDHYSHTCLHRDVCTCVPHFKRAQNKANFK